MTCHDMICYQSTNTNQTSYYISHVQPLWANHARLGFFSLGMSCSISPTLPRRMGSSSLQAAQPSFSNPGKQKEVWYHGRQWKPFQIHPEYFPIRHIGAIESGWLSSLQLKRDETWMLTNRKGWNEDVQLKVAHNHRRYLKIGMTLQVEASHTSRRRIFYQYLSINLSNEQRESTTTTRLRKRRRKLSCYPRTLDVFHFFLSILISQKDSSNKTSRFIKFHLVCSTLAMEKLFCCNDFRIVLEQSRLLFLS